MLIDSSSSILEPILLQSSIRLKWFIVQYNEHLRPQGDITLEVHVIQVQHDFDYPVNFEIK